MKKILLIVPLFLVLMLVSYVNAAEVCVAVDFSDHEDFDNADRFSECRTFSNGDTALDVLRATSLNLETKEFDFGGTNSTAICSINNVGDSSNNCFASGAWGFFTANKGDWNLASLGVSDYIVKDNDVIGFKFDKITSDSIIPEPVMMRFKEIEVRVDGDKDSGADESGGNIDKDVRPGSKIKFEVKVENLWSRNTDIEIEEPELEWEISDIDDGDEIDGDEDFDDIKEDDDETVTFTVEIPLEVEEEDFDMFITVDGDDQKGINHFIRVDFIIEIEKENNDVILQNVVLNPTTVDCSRRAELRFTVMNIGQDTEDEVNVFVTNNNLGLSFNDEFELDEEPFDDDNKETVRVPIVVPENLKAGSYPIQIKVEFDEGKDEITETKTLVVNECGASSDSSNDDKEEEKKDDQVIIVKEPDVIVVPPTTGGTVATKIVPSSSEKDNDSLFGSKGLLILEILAILVVVIIIVSILMKKKE